MRAPCGPEDYNAFWGGKVEQRLAAIEDRLSSLGRRAPNAGHEKATREQVEAAVRDAATNQQLPPGPTMAYPSPLATTLPSSAGDSGIETPPVSTVANSPAAGADSTPEKPSPWMDPNHAFGPWPKPAPADEPSQNIGEFVMPLNKTGRITLVTKPAEDAEGLVFKLAEVMPLRGDAAWLPSRAGALIESDRARVRAEERAAILKHLNTCIREGRGAMAAIESLKGPTK